MHFNKIGQSKSYLSKDIYRKPNDITKIWEDRMICLI